MGLRKGVNIGRKELNGKTSSHSEIKSSDTM